MDRLFDLDRYSSLFFRLLDREHRFLFIGIACLIVAAISTLSGGTVERFRGIVYRTEEPKRFWWDVAMFGLGGLFFIFLYEISS
jgi:hypothetical protein